MAHPNEELLRKGYEAFAAGDLAALDTMFADDILWHNGGNNALSGDYHGKEAVFGFFGRVLELTGGNFRNDVHTMFADDEHGVVVVNLHAERDGRTFDSPAVHVLHVADGKVTEFWGLVYDTRGSDEFWGPKEAATA